MQVHRAVDDTNIGIQCDIMPAARDGDGRHHGPFGLTLYSIVILTPLYITSKTATGRHPNRVQDKYKAAEYTRAYTHRRIHTHDRAATHYTIYGDQVSTGNT